MIKYDLSDEKSDKIRPKKFLGIWASQIYQRHLMDGRTWEEEWADSLKKSDAGLWEACPAAITLVAFSL